MEKEKDLQAFHRPDNEARAYRLLQRSVFLLQRSAPLLQRSEGSSSSRTSGRERLVRRPVSAALCSAGATTLRIGSGFWPLRGTPPSSPAPEPRFAGNDLGPQSAQCPPVIRENPAPLRRDTGPAIPRMRPYEEVPKLEVAQDGPDLLLFKPRKGQEFGDRSRTAQALERRRDYEPLRRAQNLAETRPHAPGLDDRSRCVPPQTRCSADKGPLRGPSGITSPPSSTKTPPRDLPKS